MIEKKWICFFSHENIDNLRRQQYSIQDIRILNDLGYKVTIATTFKQISWKCDLYFSWWASGSIFALLKAKLVNKPIIVIAGGNEAMYYQDSSTGMELGYLATSWYKKIATKLTLRFATKVLVVSNFMLENVRALGARSPLVVHNSVDSAIFEMSMLPRQYVTTSFNLEKNVVSLKRGEVFIRSIPSVLEVFPNQIFVIIGGFGDAVQPVRHLISELGIDHNVKLTGRIDNLEVVEWLQRSKVFVQISDTETFGVTIAEAMSCGTPVLVSKRGAIPEVVGDIGIFVDHNSKESVGSALILILSMSDEKRSEIGMNARNRVKKYFSYEQRKQKIKNIIDNLI